MRLTTSFRTAAFTACVFASLLAPAVAAGGRDGVSAISTSEKAAGHIENFGRVDDRYYRGAQPEEGDYAELAALGIKTVIDLTGDDNQPAEELLAEQAGMRYVRIPMTTHQPPTSAQLAEFLGIVNDPSSGPVYVHCVGGRHRTGVMTAVYRMTNDRWPADRAFQEMKRYKFGADFLHPEFKTFVYGYRTTPDTGTRAAASPTRTEPVAVAAAGAAQQ